MPRGCALYRNMAVCQRSLRATSGSRNCQCISLSIQSPLFVSRSLLHSLTPARNIIFTGTLRHLRTRIANSHHRMWYCSLPPGQHSPRISCRLHLADDLQRRLSAKPACSGLTWSCSFPSFDMTAGLPRRYSAWNNTMHLPHEEVQAR